MRGMIEELQRGITWFTQEQREEFVMLTRCEDAEIPMVLSLLEGLDSTDPERMFLTFAHEARTPRAYVDVMLELLRIRIGVLDALRHARGAGPFPPMPAELLDGQRPAAQRIEAMLTWWRSGLKDPRQVVVLALVPTKLPSVEMYREIVWPLMPLRGFEPWMRHTRVIVRDSREQPFLEPALREQEVDGVVGMTVDFSPAACEEGLAADAGNQALDGRSRGLALLQLAAMDFAQRRYAQAITKYGHLANLFDSLGDKPLTALCLVGTGDVLRQLEKYDEAARRYGQAIEVGAAAQARPVVLNAMIGLGETAMATKDFKTAETAFDGATRVAGAMGMEMPVADFVEQIGVARLGQGRAKDAWVIWERGLEYLAEPERAAPYPAREVSILERMHELAKRQGWTSLFEKHRSRLSLAKHQLSVAGGAA